MTPQFQIGQRVTTKKIGLPAFGIITSISDPTFYLSQNPTAVQEMGKWLSLYKDWLDKPVYSVELETPQRSMSYAEFQEVVHATTRFVSNTMGEVPHIDERYLKAEYKRLPLQTVFNFPEEDLENVE